MELKAIKRDILGSKVHTLREQGLIPAEVYGQGSTNEHLTVNEKEFAKVFKEAGENTVVTLVVEGKKVPVLIYDVIINPISDKVEHIDFFIVNMKEEIETAIPFEFVGESMAVKAQAGVLVKSMHEIEVRALPAHLPHSIEIDLSVLENIHDSIHVKDLKVSTGVKLLAEPDAVVATVMEQETEEVAETPISVADVKVAGEEKKKEDEKSEN